MSEAIIAHDDGTSEGGIDLGNLNVMTVKFDPSIDGVVHPYLSGFKFFVDDDSFNQSVIIQILDNSGADGMPGESLIGGNLIIPVNLIESGWYEHRFDQPIAIPNAPFYIGDYYIGGGPQVGLDDSGNSGFNYQKIGTEWSEYSEGNFMIRAIVDNPTSNDSETEIVPSNVSAFNAPNPFNPDTQIHFNLKYAGNTSIEIFNVKGQKIKSLLNEYRAIGSHSITWKGQDDKNLPVSSGVYFYKVNTDNGSVSKKMMLLK